MLSEVLQLVWPRRCCGCAVPGADICADCSAALIRADAGEARCERCAHPWPVGTTDCTECPAACDSVRYALVFDGIAVDVIHAFKDRHRRPIARLLAAEIVATVPRPDGVLIPVPSGPSRRRERGFVPAYEVVRCLSPLWDMPFDGRCLTRRGPDGDQRGASRAGRAAQVRGAFHASDSPRHVVVVDDVMTSGATLSACARALRRAGARRVDCVVATRVLSPQHRYL